MLLLVLVCAFLISFNLTDGLDNGLALTPPMGWLTWQRFRCQTNCQDYPDDCISETLLKRMADAMVSEGYKDVGYEYVVIDDCWSFKERDENDRLQSDPVRFPAGIKALADYVHSKGLKFGIYSDYGTATCAGYPASRNYLAIDAQTFADWGVDYVKFDGCNSDPHEFDTGYPAFGAELNKTGRPILYSCEWPLYQMANQIPIDYPAIVRTCNMWRNYFDIDGSWSSLAGVFRWYGDNQNDFADFAGPGGWNDPDMVTIGNFGLSKAQSQVQMALWAIMASPLILSTDLTKMEAYDKAILQNREVIAINQDPRGKQGRRVYDRDSLEVWTREINPMVNDQTSYAVAAVSRMEGGNRVKLSLSLSEINVTTSTNLNVTDPFGEIDSFVIGPSDKLTFSVPPQGVVLYKLTPIR